MPHAAVVTIQLIKPLDNARMLEIAGNVKKTFIEKKITGCCLHHKHESLHFVEGDQSVLNDLYIKEGFDETCIKVTPVYKEESRLPIFDSNNFYCEDLYEVPGADSIPILSLNSLLKLRDDLKCSTLAWQFFVKCMDELLSRSSYTY